MRRVRVVVEAVNVEAVKGGGARRERGDCDSKGGGRVAARVLAARVAAVRVAVECRR